MLPIKNRLTKKKDFQSVYKKGGYFFEKYIVLKKAKNDLKENRIGFSISTKISKKAVVRNKLKRQLRDIIKKNLDKMKKGYDLVVIPKKEILEETYQEIEKTLIELIKKAKLKND